jgi:Ran GTPase-activating protein (RanGAP) involved in mRNA processing and transport
MADGRRVRVRGREGEVVEWSRKAARRAERLKNWLDDLDPSEHSIFPIEETATTVLRTLGEMCDDDWSASSLEECSLTQLAALIEGASNLIAEQALEYAQCAFASRLEGKCAHDLLELLRAVNDFESDEERAASLGEPAFMPDSPTTQYTAARTPALPVNDDAAEAALAKVGVGMLIELKGVNRAWRALARRALCSRLCRREGRADPRQLDEITELNLEPLIEAGRPWEAVRAGRLLLHLERLTGYGFSVDVAAVREVDLEDEGDDEEEEEVEYWPLRLLRGPAKHALCNSCVTGEGEPPLALLLGAIACAGSGEIRGIPVEQMRADAFTDLDFEGSDGGAPLALPLGPEGAMLLASFLPVMGGLTSLNLSMNDIGGYWDDDQAEIVFTPAGPKAIADALFVNGGLTVANLLGNHLDVESAKMLAKVAKQKGISLCGIRRDQTTSVFSNKRLEPPDAILLASDLSQAVVTGRLTVTNLLGNWFDAESAKMLAEVAKHKGISLCGIQRDQTTADFSRQDLEPPDAILLASDLSQAIVTGMLTGIDVRYNNIAGDGAAQLSAAVLGNLKIEMFNEIPIKEMRADSFTELDLKGKVIGVVGVMVVAGLIPVMGGLTSLNLSENQLCALDRYGRGTYTAEGIAAIADALRVNGGLKALDLSDNCLKDEGVSAVCEAIQSNKETKLASLNMSENRIGPVGAKSVAAMVTVTGALTKLSLVHNKLEEEGTKAICEALENNKTLKELDISSFIGCNIGGLVGAKHVAKMLGVNGALASVKLRGNELGDEGWGAIFVAICGNKDSKIMSMDAHFENIGVQLIAEALRTSVTGALTVTNLLRNRLDTESTKTLTEVAKQKGISLCGIRRDQTTADFSDQDIWPPDAILLASDLSQAVVTGGLTELSISRNCVGDEGVGAICEAIKSNKETKLASLNFGNNGIGLVGANTVAAMVAVTGGLMSLNLSSNHIGGYWDYDQAEMVFTPEGPKAIADALLVNGALTSIDLYCNQLCGLDFEGKGIYTAEGVTAIADALRVNVALASVELRGNQLGDEGWGAIFAAICGNKDSKIMSLDASCENISPAGVQLIAEALRTSVTGALTVTNLLRNELDAESAKMLVQVAKQKGISLCGIQRDQTTADFFNWDLKPPDAILLASDLSQAVVTGGLTVTNLLGNRLNEKSAKMLAEVAKQKRISLCGIRRDQTIADFRDKYLRPPDAILLASDLSQAVVTGALTECNLRNNSSMGEEAQASIRNAAQGRFKLHL